MHSKADGDLVAFKALLENRLHAEVMIQASAQQLGELKSLRSELMALKVLHDHAAHQRACVGQLSLSQLRINSGSLSVSLESVQKTAEAMPASLFYFRCSSI